MQKNILKSAAELFLKYGIKSVSIDDICGTLRISKKTFYLHFKQKEELISSLLSEMREKHCRVRFSTDFSENVIDEILNDAVALRQSNLEKHINFMYDLMKYYPEIFREHDEEMRRRSIAFTCQRIKKGVEQGLFRDDFDVELMSAFVNLYLAQRVQKLREIKGKTTVQITDFLTESFVRLVVNEKGLDYYLNKKKEKKE